MRDSRSIAPNFAPIPPVVSALTARPVAAVAMAAPPKPKVFASDRCDGPDALGTETLIHTIAKLAVHKHAETPFCIGILGAAGSGKSFALTRLTAVADALTDQAKTHGGSPYLPRLQVVKVDAAHLDGEPMTAIAGTLCAGLSQSAPRLVEEALRAVRDPHAAAIEAADRLDQAQRRLHVERDNLAEVEGRRARLFESVLYEVPGSQVDAYARTNRPRLASRLQAFGFSGDPVLNYKDLVAGLASVQGPGGFIGLTLRSLWAFKGQTRLLMTALILALIGSGLGWAIDHQSVWLSPMRSSNDTLVSVAAWFENHMGTIVTLGKLAFIGAGLAICANLWRAFRFLQPVLRGVTLLKTEMTNRRHELDSAYAHQTRRVDGLAADVERAARLHAEADQHAGNATTQTNASIQSPFQSASGKTQAVNFTTTLTGLMAQNAASPDVPQRILFVLDNLDAVPSARASEILDAAHRLLAGAPFVTAVATDPRRFFADGAETHLEKWVQVPVRIDATAKDHAALVTQLVGQDGRGEMPAELKLPIATGAGEASLDQPLLEVERQFLSELAPLAGSSARSLKRFVNLYRLTRTLVPEHWASLAFLLALNTGGTPDEKAAFDRALIAVKPGGDVDLRESTRLSEWLAIVQTLEGGNAAEGLRHAAPIAATFSF